MIEGVELANAAARYADEKLAEDITILDLRGLSTITDFFVVCSGTSLPHLKAVRREIYDRLRTEHDYRPRSAEGELESRWIVVDCGDVIVHVFHQDMRPVYALEDLWSDAPRIPFEPETASAGGGDAN